MTLVLASNSPRRAQLLFDAGYTFVRRASDINESLPAGLPPEQAVELLAKRKGEAVGRRVDEVLLSADTVVSLDGHILGKPTDAEDACRMLHLLSGKTHEVYTGVYIQGAKENFLFHETTEVTFYELTNAEIEAYVRTGEPMDKAGAYGIQGKGALFVERINGDYLNVVGLPLANTVKYLTEAL